MSKWLLFFPDFRNEHIHKDVWMIPHYLAQEYWINFEILCYKNEDKYNLENINLKINFIQWNKYIFAIKQFFKKPDYLMLFFFDYTNIFLIIFFKMFNLKWKVYIKWDVNNINLNNKKWFKKYFYKFTIIILLYIADLLSVEVQQTIEIFKNNYWIVSKKILHIPNWFYKDSDYELNYSQKENIILTVGRIWIKPKNSKLTLEIWKEIIEKNPNWKFYIVWPVYDEDNFISYKNIFFEKNPNLIDKIVFIWPIYDKIKLNSYYIKSKIFILNSIFESFWIVLPESWYYWNILVSTNVWWISEITNEWKLWWICPINDKKCLIEKLQFYIDHPDKETIAQKQKKHIEENYERTQIISKIYNHLN